MHRIIANCCSEVIVAIKTTNSDNGREGSHSLRVARISLRAPVDQNRDSSGRVWKLHRRVYIILCILYNILQLAVYLLHFCACYNNEA